MKNCYSWLKKSVMLMSMVFVSMVSFGQLSGTYTIGGTSPSYSTITAAVSALNSSGVNGAVTFDIRSGTYTGQLSFRSVFGSSATNTIRFRPDPANTTAVVIQYSSNGSSTNWTVGFNGSSYISIDSCEIKATSTRYGRVVDFRGSNSFISFDGNDLVGRSNATSSTWDAIVWDERGTSHYANDITFKNNAMTGGSYGFYIYGNNTSAFQTNWTIENNTIEDFWYRGVMAYYVKGIEFNNNSIINRKAYTSANGIYAYYCYNASYNGNYIELVGGTSSAMGMYLYRPGASGNTTRRTISNNMVTYSDGGSAYGRGMYIYDPDYMDIVHNSINWHSTSSSTSYSALYTSSGSSVIVRNNSAFNNASGYGYYQGSSAYTNSNNNAYSVSGPNSNITQALAVDPKYNSPTDLHTYSTDLFAAGTPLTNITTDYDGETRSTTAPCIGADEYKLYSDDAGVTSMVNASLCSGSQPIDVNVRNFGTATISSFSVNWSVAIGTAAAVTQTPVAVSGSSVASGADTAVGLGNYTLNVGSNYTFKVWTSLPNLATDSAAANDTLTITISPALSGVYTVGSGTSDDYASITAAVAALSSKGVCGAVELRLQDETFNEQVEIGTIPGGSAINTVIIKSDPANANMAKWEFNTASTAANYVVRFNGVQYLSIDTVVLQSLGTNYGGVVEFQGNNQFITLNGDSLIGRENGTNFTYDRVIYDYTGGNQANDITIKNCVIMGGNYSMYIYGQGNGSSRQQRWTIENNELYNFMTYGIYMFYTEDVVVTKNKIVGNDSRFVRGIYGYYFLGDVTYNTVNIAQGYAFDCQWSDGASSNHGKITNNMFAVTDGNYTGTCYGLQMSRSQWWDVQYNSFYTASTGGNSRSLYLTSANNTDVRNNVGVAEAGYGFYQQSASGARDYNNWYCRNGQNISGFTQGSNSVNTDPLFADASKGDLHAASALMYREGIPIVGITDDIDEEVRSTTVPTMGADEYVVPDYDAGVTDFPSGALCTGVQAIEVTVGNLGYLNLTSFDVHWTYSVNGAAATAGATLSVSGSNVDKGLDTVVTLGNITLNSGSTYSIVAYTVSPSGQADQRTANDTFKFDVRPALTGTFTIGSNGDYGSFADAVKDLDDLGICGPVTFHVDDSTFVESITLDGIVGVSGTNPLTFTSDPANTSMAVLEGNLEFGDITYVEFDNMHLKSTSGYTVNLNGLNDNLTIDSCIVEAGSSSSANACIYDMRGKNTSNLFITNSEIFGGYYGIYINGGSSARNQRDEFITIEGNAFHDIGIYYVYTYYAANCHYNDNSVETNTTGTQYVFFGRYNNDMQYKNNRMNMRSSGFQYAIYDYYPNYYNRIASDSTEIINNFISFSNDLATSGQYGIYTYYGTRVIIQHNNIRLNTSSTSYGGYEYNPSYTNVSNNIFSSERGNSQLYFRGNSTWGPSVVNNTRKSNGYWTGTSGNWATNGFTRDASAINAKPRFKGPEKGDLRVNAVEYDSAAFNVGVTTDHFHSPRNIPFHDVGAHEFTPCYFDGGMINVSSIYSSVPTGQSVYVFGEAGNRGLDTITGTRVNALVAGVSSNTLIDTLAPEQDSTVAVLASVGAVSGQISANFFTTINESDCDSTNDTLNYIINVSDSIYALDDSLRGIYPGGGLGYATGTTGEFGNVYEVFSTDKMTSGTFYLDNPIRGASVKLKLYAVNDTASPAVQQVIDSTRAFQISANGTGWYTLEFGCGGVTLQPGKYLIAIQQINPVRMNLGFSSIRTGRPGIMYSRGTGGSWADLNAQGGLVGNATLILRANFGEIADKQILADTTLLCFGSTAQVKPNKEYKFNTWSTGEFFDSIKVTKPGIISVTVEDEIGCIYMDTTNVVRTQQIVLNETVTNATCDSSDGVAVAMATGIYGPYTYEWDNGYIGATLAGIPGDIYNVTAIDSVGCTEELEVEVLGARPLVSSTNSYPTCNGDNDGSAEVAVTKGIPGYTYKWNSGGTNAKESNLSAGAYTVTVTDKSNCDEVVSITVIDPPVIQVIMKDNTPSACKLANGSAEAAVAGGIAPFTYFWSNSQTTGKAVGLTKGVYDVTITDSLGCVKTGKVKVIDPNSPIAVPSNLSLDCSYDTATAELTINGGTGPFKYTWSTGSSATQLNGLTKGLYQVRVEDSAGCDHDTVVVINAPDPINVSFINVVDGGENNVKATASAIGGTKPYSSYLWSNNETDSTATNLPNGVNTVTVVDANGCSFKAQIDIFSEFTGVGVLGNTDAFRIYPNPTAGVINLEFNLTSEEDVTVRVMNAVGQVIETTEKTRLTQDNVTLDITGYASGIYFVETTVGTEKVVSRIQLSK